MAFDFTVLPSERRAGHLREIAILTICTVTIELEGSGTVSKSGVTVPEGSVIIYSGNVLYVGSIEVTAVPSSGSVFDHWDHGGGVWGNVTVHAVFSA